MPRIESSRPKIASKGLLRAWVAPVLVLCALLIVSGAPEHRSAPFSYSIIDLGTLGGFSSVALDINDLGHVCGSADMPNGYRHAYFWKDGVMTDCGLLPGPSQTEAWGINNHDQVVGIASSDGNTAKAFIWQNGLISDLAPTNVSKSAYAINDAGQIVGQFIAPGGNKHAYLLQNGILTDLEPPSSTGGLAWDINAAGLVAGGSNSVPVGGAAKWEDGTMTPLGSLGGNASLAIAINDPGDIVGWSYRAGNEQYVHAFLWHNGVMSDVPGLEDCLFSEAEDINNKGEIVGGCALDVGGGAALVVPPSSVYFLQELLLPDSGWTQLYPRAMNEAGQIVGDGEHNGQLHAFLMTRQPPIPAAGGFGLAILALSVCALGAVVVRRVPSRK